MSIHTIEIEITIPSLLKLSYLYNIALYITSIINERHIRDAYIINYKLLDNSPNYFV